MSSNASPNCDPSSEKSSPSSSKPSTAGLKQLSSRNQTQASKSSTHTSDVDAKILEDLKETHRQDYDENAIDDNEYTPPHSNHRQSLGKKLHAEQSQQAAAIEDLASRLKQC